MSTTLPHGIIQINEGNIAWYGDITANWQLIDSKIGVYDAAIAAIPAPANNGTLTINYGGTTIAMFGADNAGDVSADIPAPGDGTLTIQRNGTTVDTFTANASVDKTINISTADDTKIPLAGSNAISGDLIPSTDGTVNLGGPSYQWNNAYIKSLTISDGINNKNVQRFIFNKEYNDTTDNWLDIHRYLDKNSTRIGFYSIGDFNSNRSFRWFVRGRSTNSAEVDIFGFGRTINETSYMYINATLETDLIPTDNNSKSLGTSTNKWKSLNGINPGALSLPGDAYIDIDTTNYAWGSNFTFTPDYDGYCFISIGSSSYSRMISLKTGRGEYYFSNQTDVFRFTFPVYKGKLVTIWTNSSGTESVLPTIRVFPCQGNV